MLCPRSSDKLTPAAAGACPGKVGTGFPARTCAKPKNLGRDRTTGFREDADAQQARRPGCWACATRARRRHRRVLSKPPDQDDRTVPTRRRRRDGTAAGGPPGRRARATGHRREPRGWRWRHCRHQSGRDRRAGWTHAAVHLARSAHDQRRRLQEPRLRSDQEFRSHRDDRGEPVPGGRPSIRPGHNHARADHLRQGQRARSASHRSGMAPSPTCSARCSSSEPASR